MKAGKDRSVKDWTFGRDIVDRFVERFQRTFPAYSKEDLRRRGFRDRWTSINKNILCEMATEKGFRPRCSGFHDDREFLFDLVWTDRNGGRMELALESELGREWEVIEDLEKLLYAKTNTKIVICDPSPAEGLGEEVRRVLEEYGDHRAGEHYLVLQMGCRFWDEHLPSSCEPTLHEARVHDDGGTPEMGSVSFPKFPLGTNLA